MKPPFAAPRWFASELWRSLLSGAGALLVGGLVALGSFFGPPRLRDVLVWTVVLAAWGAFVLVHAALTAFAFEGLEEDDLSEAIRYARRDRTGALPRRTASQLLAGSGDGPSWSVQMSVVALLVVVALALSPQLQGNPLLTGLGLVLVAGCWLDVMTMYALHYARLDSSAGGLEFSGDDPKCFTDYVHLAVGVQTLGTADTRVTTRSMRRQVSLHSLLAFAFNTVIIVMIVSLILRLG